MAETNMEIDSEDLIIRPNSVWIHGVDDLSTNDVKTYIKKHTEKEFKIEWINDSSINVVFETDEIANTILQSITISEDEIDIKSERLIHPIVDTKKDIAFTARISTTEDKKVKNAAQYSRYYLFNPKEERSKPRKNNYRERDQITRRRRNNEDSDLFPTKIIERNDDEPIVEETENNQSLLERIGESIKPSSKIASKDLDDDDLFKQ